MSVTDYYRSFGVHFDHHASPQRTPNYGAGTDVEQVRAYLRRVRPDFVQYHTLGTHGYINYPSEVCTPVPGLVGDPPARWKEACDAEGVPFGCYMAGAQKGLIPHHPEWAAIDRNGEIVPDTCCLNGPWTDELVLPLAGEIVRRYNPAHIWFDGSWLRDMVDVEAIHHFCVCPHCRQRYAELYEGDLLREMVDPNWLFLREFYERCLDAWVVRVADGIKQVDPDVCVAFNSMYYFKDLRAAAPNVDWVSFDCVNEPDLDNTAFQAQYLATAGKPADLMIFEKGISIHGTYPRPDAQLLTEAAMLLANGVRVNIWQNPRPDGSLYADSADKAATIGEFVRQREWCIDNDSAAETAVLATLLDHNADWRTQQRRARSACQMLRESHIPADVVRADTLFDRIDQYRLVVLPGVRCMLPDTAGRLKEFVAGGGTVLMLPCDSPPAPADWTGTLTGRDKPIEYTLDPAGEIDVDGRLIDLPGLRIDLPGWDAISALTDGKTWLGGLTVGDGRVLATAGNVVDQFSTLNHPGLRRLIGDAAREGLGDAPMIELDATSDVHVTVNRRDGDLYVHLVSVPSGPCSGDPHRFFDAPVLRTGVELTVRPPAAPSGIVALPGEQAIDASESGGALRIGVPDFEVHVAIRLSAAAG